MRILAFLAALLALPLSACLTVIPDRTGYEVNGSRVRWVGITMGSVLAEVARVDMRDADAATFRDLGQAYAVDSRHAYYQGRILVGDDPATFRRIEPDHFAASAQHIYYRGLELEGANPATWRILEGAASYSTDGVYVFTGSVRLEGADPATFKVYDSTRGLASDGRNFYYYNIREGGIEDCGPPIRPDLTLTRVPYFCALFGVANPPRGQN
jgi:hypothetical protein